MRLTIIKSAKAVPVPRKCRRCGHEIQPGESYKHAKPRYGGARYWCHKCTPRPSDLASNDREATVLAAMEGVEDQIDATDKSNLADLVTTLQSAAEEIRGVGEEYQESAQNIEEGFGHSTSQSEEIADKASQIEDLASELENAASEIEDLENRVGALQEDEDNEEKKDVKEEGKTINEAIEDIVEEAKETASNACSSSPF